MDEQSDALKDAELAQLVRLWVRREDEIRRAAKSCKGVHCKALKRNREAAGYAMPCYSYVTSLQRAGVEPCENCSKLLENRRSVRLMRDEKNSALARIKKIVRDS